MEPEFYVQDLQSPLAERVNELTRRLTRVYHAMKAQWIRETLLAHFAMPITDETPDEELASRANSDAIRFTAVKPSNTDASRETWIMSRHGTELSRAVFRFGWPQYEVEDCRGLRLCAVPTS